MVRTIIAEKLSGTVPTTPENNEIPGDSVPNEKDIATMLEHLEIFTQ